jgi:hypothetical protein
LVEAREVSDQEISSFIEETKPLGSELVSAKTGKNVSEVFYRLIVEMLARKVEEEGGEDVSRFATVEAREKMVMRASAMEIFSKTRTDIYMALTVKGQSAFCSLHMDVRLYILQQYLASFE